MNKKTEKTVAGFLLAKNRVRFSETARNTKCDMYVIQAGEPRPPYFGICEFKWDFPRKSRSASIAGHR